jgi:hypothetical protein
MLKLSEHSVPYADAQCMHKFLRPYGTHEHLKNGKTEAYIRVHSIIVRVAKELTYKKIFIKLKSSTPKSCCGMVEKTVSCYCPFKGTIH